MPVLSEYLQLTPDAARNQWRALRSRGPAAAGKRQVPFVPVETLMCLFASFVVRHNQFGGSTAHRAPTPVPELSRLFHRPPSSILAKMANVDGTRSNGAVNDLRAGTALRADPELATATYRTLIAGARAAGVSAEELPDFLGLEFSGQFQLLGQEELSDSAVESVLEAEVRLWQSLRHDLTLIETEQLVITSARIGQHRFATGVLDNCGRQCVFCGLSVGGGSAARLLVASHIKPWRESAGNERLDIRNGLAACPTHDVAFDTGLLTVAEDLSIRLAPSLVDEVQRPDNPGRIYFAQPPMRRTVQMAVDGQPPAPKYLRWHQENIFAA